MIDLNIKYQISPLVEYRQNQTETCNSNGNSLKW